MTSCPILSCSAPAGVTLQLLACLAREQLLMACSHESPARSSHEFLFFLHTLEYFFTLSHSLPLQESHRNTGLLIAEIQANLARNKANKIVDKIQLYIQDHNQNISCMSKITVKIFPTCPKWPSKNFPTCPKSQWKIPTRPKMDV